MNIARVAHDHHHRVHELDISTGMGVSTISLLYELLDDRTQLQGEQHRRCSHDRAQRGSEEEGEAQRSGRRHRHGFSRQA